MEESAFHADLVGGFLLALGAALAIVPLVAYFSREEKIAQYNEPSCTYGRDFGRDEICPELAEEDAAAVEVQQGNLVSGRAREFRFVSNREEPALFINRLIWEAYKSHLSGGDGSDQPLQAAE